MEPVLEWDVVVIGGINTDYLIRGRELPGPGMSRNGTVFLEAPGGKGANAAVAASRLGARTAIIGKVGHDQRGKTFLEHLTRAGVHAVQVTLDDDPAPTGAAVIQVDGNGQKQILAALGANLHLRVADVEAAAETIRSSRVLVAQLEVPVECVNAAIRIASQAGVCVVFDPAPPSSLPDDLLARVDVIRANATLRPRNSRAALRHWQRPRSERRPPCLDVMSCKPSWSRQRLRTHRQSDASVLNPKSC